MSGELKAECIQVLQKFVQEFQDRKAAVTDDLVKTYMDATRKISYIENFPAPLPQEPKKEHKKKSSSKQASSESLETKG
jgi:tryptophanyl-tRNA synthetase